jgi:hypothetical protein
MSLGLAALLELVTLQQLAPPEVSLAGQAEAAIHSWVAQARSVVEAHICSHHLTMYRQGSLVAHMGPVVVLDWKSSA